MSNRGADHRQTEAYAERYEKEYLDIESKKTQVTVGVYEKVASLLSGGRENYPKIRALIHENMDVYMHDSGCAEIAQLVQIYTVETVNHMDHVILDISDDLSVILSVLRQLKYMLFRVEFGKITDDGNELCKLISDNNISLPALDNMVDWCSYDKSKVYMALAMIFLKHNLYDHALYSLECYDTLTPGNAEINSLINRVKGLMGRV